MRAPPFEATLSSQTPATSILSDSRNNFSAYKDEVTVQEAVPTQVRVLKRKAAHLEQAQEFQAGVERAAKMRAGDGTTITPTTQTGARTRTSALYVAEITLRGNVPSHRGSEDAMGLHRRPRYARDLVWDADDGEEHSRTPSASATERASPLPSVPKNELANLPALRTIALRPDLFKIITPIDVDKFSRLLETHPNRPFVNSVCHGLRNGFWPYADTSDPKYPTTWDNSARPVRDPAHAAFLSEERDKEVLLGRWSAAFGDALLPGMYAMPLGVVPKPRSNKFRMVNDQSAGEFALNNMIDRASAAIKLDGIRDLGTSIRKALRGEDKNFCLFKSDVRGAYRLMPLHPLWQIRQIVRVDGALHVNRTAAFGNTVSGKIFGSFMGLVLWIAIFVKYIMDLLAYVDDVFGYDRANNVAWYEPYQIMMPAKQAALLSLWDELAIPHDREKQISSVSLPIIGFNVDLSTMRVSMPEESRSDLVIAIRSFVRAPPSGHRRHSLRDFQRLAGWINWALNTYPLLRPGLSALYDKISGKTRAHAPIALNLPLIRELTWIARHLEKSNGISLLLSLTWGPAEASFAMFTDASLKGLGFWSPMHNVGFQAQPPADFPTDGIYLLEALAVVAALEWASRRMLPGDRLAIFTDNSNTVNMFYSMHALPRYNPLLIYAVDILIAARIELRVYHIPGVHNTVADHLSRWRNEDAAALVPGITISSFKPPRITLGAVKK